MGLRTSTPSGYKFCDFHSKIYAFSALNYKQRVVAITAFILFSQFVCLGWWGIHRWWIGTNGDPTWGWWYIFGLFGAVWPVYYLIAWIGYCWKFRRSRWACTNDDNDGAENDNHQTYHDDGDDAAILFFPLDKFSNN